jgi:hypothetical protein
MYRFITCDWKGIQAKVGEVDSKLLKFRLYHRYHQEIESEMHTRNVHRKLNFAARNKIMNITSLEPRFSHVKKAPPPISQNVLPT